MQCLQKPEEGIISLGAEVRGYQLVLETQTAYSARAVSVLNFYTISLASVIII